MEAKGLYAKLTPAELTALAVRMATARQACRKVMRDNWANAEVTETYRQIVIELINADPLFGKDVKVPPYPPKPHLLAKDQWQVW